MKKIAIILMFTMIASAVEARTYYDIFGTNKKKKLEFANQVIKEVLTPEEFSRKRRTTELVQADGDNIIIDEYFPGDVPRNETNFYYEFDDMHDEKNPPSQEKLIESSKEREKRIFIKNYKISRKLPPPSHDAYKFKIIENKPRDITYTSRAVIFNHKGAETENSLISVFRRVRVGYWDLMIGYIAVVPNKVLEEKTSEFSDRLNNSQSVNNWISQNRPKGL